MIFRRRKISQTVFITCLLLFFTSANLIAQDGPTDDEISTAVEQELFFNATTPEYLISSDTEMGIVTLTGTVDNLLEKDRAVKIAETVKGVRGVIDLIEVDAPDIADNELKNEVDNALLNDPATDSYEIDIVADNGKVELIGTVDSWQEKQLSEFVAKGVKGVKEVENNLGVEYKVTRPDYEIKKDIQQALKNDIRVDHGLINVNVDDGFVTLSGTVGSVSERNIAVANSWVSGVELVTSNELDIEEWARNENFRKDKYEIRSDEEVKNAIRTAFIYDPRVYSFNPEISVNSGIVTLSGEVDNLKAKRAAEQDAKNIVGVINVVNNLKVVPLHVVDDIKLEAKTTEALTKDPIIEDWEINVEAVNGEIYLSGTVDTYFERAQAEDIASKINGVVDVENDIEVNDYNNAYYSNYYGWNTFYPPYYIRVDDTQKSDAEIEEDVQSQLWWSPFVNEDEVNVSVNDGTVKLEGVVDTQREKLYAEINAIEGGAKEVDNELTVIYTP